MVQLELWIGRWNGRNCQGDLDSRKTAPPAGSVPVPVLPVPLARATHPLNL